MTATEHSTTPHGRARKLEALRAGTFDLLVIGGGINGAGIARDAAMRGLRVALIEKGDFASGTSSKSSKLIHGGIRYLQMGDFRLVRTACRERDLLRRRLAPHLVQPLPFLFPVYEGDPVGLVALTAGMWLYDLLAAFRNIRRHRMLSKRRILAAEPHLRSAGLHGAAFYYDCITDDARLTLETVLAAEAEGALATNYVELRSFIKKDGRIAGATVGNQLTGDEFVIHARTLVNATGPWADHVRRIDDPTVRPCLRLTKGVHLIVPRQRVGNNNAVVMHSPRDKRVLFVIPWGAHTIIGTTDTDFSGSPDSASADDADIDYLLETANWFFPTARLDHADVVSTYAGVRSLVAAADVDSPSAVSREEQIFESATGLITLAGGKLTTYRSVAEETVDLVLARLGDTVSTTPTRRGSPTKAKPLPGGWPTDPESNSRELTARNGSGLTPDQIAHLARRYGSRTEAVVSLARSDDDLKESIISGLPDIWAEAVFAAREEMARLPDDILLRRTNVALKAPKESAQLLEKIRQKLRIFAD